MKNFRNIPTSSQWITFPVSSKDKMTINWEDDFHGYVHTYYMAKCYFGILENLELPKESVVNNKLEVPNPIFTKGNTKLTVLGETKIYIAAEFIEDEYAESPSDLGQFHLKDIARAAGREGKFPWVTMKLNGAFCYGQNGTGNRLRRYIVYHPSVGPGIHRPNIHQHRFTDTEISNAIRKGLEGATEDMPEKYKFLGATLSQLIKVLHKKGKAALGDCLWVFLDDPQLSVIDINYPVPKFLRDETGLRTRLEQIQILEFGATGKDARAFQRKHLLAPPGDQVPFVPPVPSEQQEEQKAEEKTGKVPEKAPEKVPEKTREELEMENLDRMIRETLQIIADVDEENQKEKSNSPRHTIPAGRLQSTSSAEEPDNIRNSRNRLMEGNTGEKLPGSTSPTALFDLWNPSGPEKEKGKKDATKNKSPEVPFKKSPIENAHAEKAAPGSLVQSVRETRYVPRSSGYRD